MFPLRPFASFSNGRDNSLFVIVEHGFPCTGRASVGRARRSSASWVEALVTLGVHLRDQHMNVVICSPGLDELELHVRYAIETKRSTPTRGDSNEDARIGSLLEYRFEFSNHFIHLISSSDWRAVCLMDLFDIEHDSIESVLLELSREINTTVAIQIILVKNLCRPGTVVVACDALGGVLRVKPLLLHWVSTTSSLGGWNSK